MIARTAQIALLFELLVYGGLGQLLVSAGRTGWSGALLLAVLLAIALRLVLTTIPFLLVLAHRVMEGKAVAWGDFSAAFVREAWAKGRSFTLDQPFQYWLMAADPPPVPGPLVPVLLVHGYVCNRGSWQRMRALLAARLPNPIFTISLEPPLATIDSYVPQLAQRIESICSATGQPKLILVCHSMGGLVARTYLTRHRGDVRVAHLITLASPHRGTRVAKLGIGANVRQMVFDNDWVNRLGADEAALAARVGLTSIYTENDNLVYPPESAELPHAANIRLRGIGHVSMQYSADVADVVARIVLAGQASAGIQSSASTSSA